MAEVVGLVASVVTLGELTTKVVKLKSLWDKVRNVPEDIQSQLDELETLNILITEVEAEAAAEQDALRDTPAGALGLRYCKKAAKELEDVIQNLQRNIKSPARLRRTAAKFGAVLSQKTILDAQRQLSKAFQMLQFAVTVHMWFVKSPNHAWLLVEKSLISSGDASLYDRDDNGKTLLHVSWRRRKHNRSVLN